MRGEIFDVLCAAHVYVNITITNKEVSFSNVWNRHEKKRIYLKTSVTVCDE